jgi:7-cyano-7-deazaguanine synthase in queuosine biosynthesis
MKFYLGPDNIEWASETYFPIADDTVFAVLFSGGADSTLVATLAIELYGKDRVVLLWSDSMFCEDNNEVKQSIKRNVETVSKYLGLPAHYVSVNYDHFLLDPLIATTDAWMAAQQQYKFTDLAMGITAMFWDIMPLQSMSRQEILDYCFANRQKNKRLIEQWHMDNDIYTTHLKMNIDPKVYNWIQNNLGVRFHFPLNNLYKPEIVDLYFKLNKQDVLYSTMSCLSKTGKHCGECWNCQNRYDAHDINGYVDQTEYTSNLIKQRRKQVK